MDWFMILGLQIMLIFKILVKVSKYQDWRNCQYQPVFKAPSLSLLLYLSPGTCIIFLIILRNRTSLLASVVICVWVRMVQPMPQQHPEFLSSGPTLSMGGSWPQLQSSMFRIQQTPSRNPFQNFHPSEQLQADTTLCDTQKISILLPNMEAPLLLSQCLPTTKPPLPLAISA